MTGRVKWFDDGKGYGFIKSDSHGEVYVHYTNVAAEGFKSLKPEQIVEFELYEGPKGKEAKNVKVL